MKALPPWRNGRFSGTHPAGNDGSDSKSPRMSELGWNDACETSINYNLKIDKDHTGSAACNP
jgi:hypothetical protein